MKRENDLYQGTLTRRIKLNLVGDCTQIKDENSTLPSIDFISLCDTYDDEGYDILEEDFPRNRAYCRAINNIPRKQNLNWLEIGCGANALLSRIVLQLHQDSRVTAFEVNKNSAEHARKITRSISNKCGIIHSSSILKKEEIESTISQKPNSFDIIIHELFGFIASSEGCAVTMNHAIQNYKKKNGYCLPSKAASFFTLTSLTPKSFDDHEVVYLTPKFFLSHQIEIHKYMLADKSCCFEYFDFNSDNNNGNNNNKNNNKEFLELNQDRKHQFSITKEGILNSITTFIYIDLSIPTNENNNNNKKNNNINIYPYGDSNVPLNNSKATIDSFYYPKSKKCAENWMNLVILLPNPIKVKLGDIIMVNSKVKLDSLQPSYSFVVSQYKDSTVQTITEINLEFNDLYPDYKNI